MRLMVMFSYVALFVTSLATPAMSDADLLIFGGTIYTAEKEAPTVESVLVERNIIRFTGPLAEAESLAGPETRRIDLKGAVMFPGFTDAHVHLRGIGERELGLNLAASVSSGDALARVAEWATRLPAGATLYGRGWIETHWPEQRFLTAKDIDAVVSDRPVILERADGHAIVLNSEALKQAGIGKDTISSDGGEIVKDDQDDLTGMLNDNAQALASPLLQDPDEATRRAAYLAGDQVYTSRGWTGVYNVSVEYQDVALMERLSDDGDLNLRVANAVLGRDAGSLIREGARANSSGLVSTGAIKFVLDGALGSRGAALDAPYSDADTDGLLTLQKSTAMPLFEGALRSGIQIATHAIGDRANRLLLDWYEEAFATVPSESRAVADPRWRNEHSQIINPMDLKRFAELGVIASMQPSHAIGDFHFAPDRLGDERLNGAYAWQSLIKSGAIVAAGSDAPVEVGDPIIEFYAATVRRDLKGFAADNWHLEERVSRRDALKMFTIWPAYARFSEDRLGSIKVGKLADFSIFSDDLMTVPDSELLAVKPVLTIINGKIAWRAAD